MRGLVIDTQLGNLVKADRFGYVKRAYHGTTRLEFEEQRGRYARTLVDLAEPRWVFLNTFFSLSEAVHVRAVGGPARRGRLPGRHGYAGPVAARAPGARRDPRRGPAEGG